MRLRGMVRKESLQILRDPSSIAIAFIMPVVLLLLFGYGVSLDAQHIPLAMVIEHPDANSASFAAAFQQSEYFSPRRFDSIRTPNRPCGSEKWMVSSGCAAISAAACWPPATHRSG